MFGGDDVRRAYEEYLRLQKDVIISLAQIKAASDDALDTVAAAKEPPGWKDRPLREWPTVADRVKELLRILDAADEAESHLNKVIGTAVRRVPTDGQRQKWPNILRRRTNPLSTAAIKSDFWTGGDQHA